MLVDDPCCCVGFALYPIFDLNALDGEFLSRFKQIARPFGIVHNLPAHKVSGVEAAIRKAGASLLYLPSYSPDLNPIENMQRWNL